MAKTVLATDGIRLGYLRLSEAYSNLDTALFEQQYGSHADEHATSLMLHIAPQVVDMSKAVDDGAEGEGSFTNSRSSGRVLGTQYTIITMLLSS